MGIREHTAEMVRMREEGMTVTAIAEHYGVSKQCISQLLPRTRTGLAVFKQIKYKGIREYLTKKAYMSTTSFVNYVKHGADAKWGLPRATVQHYMNMFCGKNELRLSLIEIRNILELTGLIYDKAFEEER